jgi:SAM-dependent methyltransferase
MSPVQNAFQMVGSDPDNFGCYYCGSSDRERHLFMYFDHLTLWTKFEGADILHFAPETHLKERIEQIATGKYICGDLNPKNSSEVKLDATNIEFEDASFDCIIANHILEHIPSYKLALSEFHRVLKPNGFALLQTPYSRLLTKNFEDAGINTPKLMKYFHGQNDHVRTFSETHLLGDLKDAGFD